MTQTERVWTILKAVFESRPEVGSSRKRIPFFFFFFQFLASRSNEKKGRRTRISEELDTNGDTTFLSSRNTTYKVVSDERVADFDETKILHRLINDTTLLGRRHEEGQAQLRSIVQGLLDREVGQESISLQHER